MSTFAEGLATTPVPPQKRPTQWGVVLWFTLLSILCYLPVLALLVQEWNENEDMGHGFFVPILAAYIGWQKKDELLAGPLRMNWLGLLVVLYAGLQLLIATVGAELFLARTAYIVAVAGIVLFLGGWHAIRTLAFPLALLLFMVPLPAIIYNQITFPLQIFASRVAAYTLENVFTIPVLRDGNVIELASQKLSVVEACSGIRSLLSLTFLALIYGHFFDNRGWMKVVLLLATVPIAILANAGRVTLSGIQSEINTEYAHGAVHMASGWVIFVIALVALVAFHQLLDKALLRLRKRA